MNDTWTFAPRRRRRWIVPLAIVCLGLSLLAMPSAAEPPTGCLGEAVNDNRATDVDDYLSGTNDVDVIALGDGWDQYFAADGPDYLCGNDGTDVVAGEAGADHLNGGGGNDIAAGLGGADWVSGGAGSDEVSGGAGDDTVRGGDDVTADTLYDGFGSDVIVGGEEDTWFRCDDGENDDHDSFLGQTLPDPGC